MRAEIITSLQNPQVKLWRTLNRSRAERVKSGLYLAEGEHMAGEALQEEKALALLVSQQAEDKYAALIRAADTLPVYLLADYVMAAICDAKTPQGVAAVCAYPQDADVASLGHWLVALDGVQDPGNVGTIIRTMDAAGFTGLLMDEKTADPYAPKPLRASMGGVFRIPALRCESLPQQLDALAKAGYAVIAGDLHGQPFYDRPPAPDRVCVVIGNEGAGVSPAVLEKATLRLKLPIPGKAESLNAAVAGSIMMYDLLRETLGKRRD